MVGSKGRYSYFWCMLVRETQEDVWGLVLWVFLAIKGILLLGEGGSIGNQKAACNIFESSPLYLRAIWELTGFWFLPFMLLDYNTCKTSQKSNTHFIISTTPQIWECQRNRWQGDMSGWLPWRLHLPSWSQEKQLFSCAEAWPLNPVGQGITAGLKQEGTLLTQPCMGQELWQEGHSVCSGQLISPLQNPAAAQEPMGSSPLALGFARGIGSPCDKTKGTWCSLLVLLCFN